MTEGPLLVLPRDGGRSYIETGLIVMREPHDRAFVFRPDAPEHEMIKAFAYTHEWIHYLQSLTCGWVTTTANRMLRVAGNIVARAARGSVHPAAEEKFREIEAELYGRRDEENFHSIDEGERVLLFFVPPGHQIGAVDLLEGVAFLETFKHHTSDASVGDYLAFRDRYFPGNHKNVYRRSFDFLAHAIGAGGAYELLAPISFLALQTDSPPDDFARLVDTLPKRKGGDYSDLAEIDALDQALNTAHYGSWMEEFESGKKRSRHPILDECSLRAIQELGPTRLRALGAAPSRVTPEIWPAVHPPVVVYSGAEKVTFKIAKFAAGPLYQSIVQATAFVGAARRLTTYAEKKPYQFCPHGSTCRHYASALCHSYYGPPATFRSHDDCAFPDFFRKASGLEPDALWAAVGRAPMTLPELMTAFEKVSEADIWALVRRQRPALEAWLGTPGYSNLERGAHATAEKLKHALETQKNYDFVEARYFRDALVNGILKKGREIGDRAVPDHEGC